MALGLQPIAPTRPRPRPAPARRPRPAPAPTMTAAMLAAALGACGRACAKARTQRRVSSLLVVWLVISVLIAARLVDIQVVRAEEFRGLADRQSQREIALPAARGALLDRGGHPLAMSLSASTVYANPPVLREEGIDPWLVAATVSPVLQRPTAELAALLGSQQEFVFLGRQLPRELGEQVLALDLPGDIEGLPGIGVLEEPTRTYPSGTLASQTVGWAGVDNSGLAGLELAYDQELGGIPGTLLLERAPGGLEITSAPRTVTEPVSGADLVLTLDRGIQQATEEILADAVSHFQALGGSAIVLDSASGEILALASVPTFHPEQFAGADPYAQRNRALTDVFEPGSVNKAVTIAAAIEDGVVGPGTTLTVPSAIAIGPEVFHDASSHGTAQWTVADIIERSSNVGAIQIAQQLGRQRLHDYVTAFGMGRPTGLGFPGESAGLLPDVPNWSGSSLPTIAIGQGVSATLLQLAGAFNVIATGGEWVEPSLVRGHATPDGGLIPGEEPARSRVISERTAALVADMLVAVVAGDHGTGRRAAVPGYEVAGKTGTAQKPLEDARGYEEGAFIGTFAGFAPAHDPALVVAVMLDEPTPYYGGLSAAPTFSAIMAAALAHRGIPPDTTGELPPAAGSQPAALEATAPLPPSPSPSPSAG